MDKSELQKLIEETIREKPAPSERVETDVVGYDLCGYPYNKKYPPDKKRYPHDDGYSSPQRATLFYDFAVQGYDLWFIYHGKSYYCLYEPSYVALCDSHFREEYQRFENGNVFIETFEIEGHKLIDIIDDLEYVDPM